MYVKALFHICKAFYRCGKVFYSLIGISMLYAIPHTVTDMSFKHHLAYFMERRACGTYLGQHILAWLILIHHPVHSLQLSHNFTDSLMKILAVHTFFHTLSPLTK